MNKRLAKDSEDRYWFPMAKNDDPTKQLKKMSMPSDSTNGDQLLVYGTDRGVRVDVRYKGETLWMTQRQMADLFGVTVPTVSRHVTNILEEGELSASCGASTGCPRIERGD